MSFVTASGVQAKVYEFVILLIYHRLKCITNMHAFCFVRAKKRGETTHTQCNTYTDVRLKLDLYHDITNSNSNSYSNIILFDM